MKILWFTNIMMPEFARAVGCCANCYGGWMPALVDAIRQYAPDCDLTIACAGHSIAKVEIDRVNYVCLGKVSGAQFNALARDVVQQVRPDVIHVHGTELIAQSIPLEILKRRTTVLSLQGVMAACGDAYMGGLSVEDLRPYHNVVRRLLRRPRAEDVARLWKMEKSSREAQLLSSIQHVIGRTSFDREWVRRLAPQANYFHVDEVLRPEFFAAQRSVDRIRNHSIYCSSAMSYPLKGGHVLLKAISKLRKHYPDICLRVADSARIRPARTFSEFCRQGDYAAYLNAVIQRENLSGNVELLGMLNANDVALELVSAECFCLASFMENSPNSLCEAMLVGTPVITTGVGGISSLIRLREECICVGAGDSDGIANSIAFAFDHPGVMSQMSLRAKSVALSRHNSRTIVQTLMNVYNSILKDA